MKLLGLYKLHGSLKRLSPPETLLRSVSSRPPEMVEDDDGGPVYLAAGKSEEKTIALLEWSCRTFRTRQIWIVHVHKPSQVIPTLLGKLPASQANPAVVAAFRNQEWEKTRRLLSRYLSVCCRLKVEARLITIEADQVQKGIVDIVNKHCIRALVIGAIPDYVKGKSSSCKASYAAKHVPSFCEIWFVHKGKLVWTRRASESSPSAMPICQPALGSPFSLRSRSLNSYNVEADFHPEDHSSVQHEGSQADVTLSPTLPSIKDPSDALSSQGISALTSSSSVLGGSQYVQLGASSVLNTEVEKECLTNQLHELEMEAEASRNVAFMEYLGRAKVDAELVEAISKVKALGSAHAHQVELRREAEAEVRTIIAEQEDLLEEKQRITGELQKTIRNIALLDSRAQEAERRHEEVAGELKLVQASIATLRQENKKLQHQKIEAMRWLESWQSRRQNGDANVKKKFVGLLGDNSELVELSLLDLQTATCNFSDSFLIGRGGYGIVYKGEMLGRTVAIKKLHPCNIRGLKEFHQEVQLLGKLHHPHLVALVGICLESWSLVYEYLPGGTLRDHLLHCSNICPLKWKIRTRIVADIANALFFLHSSKPEKIVHGDLKPENILLDSENNCKLSDCGVFRLIKKQSFRCPSFGRSTEPGGAFSYTDPEFHRTGELTPKSDIYSFGLIILQLVTGRTLVGLVGEVRKAVSVGSLASILDSSAGDWSTFVARRLVDFGLKCCELNSRDRPEFSPTLLKELECLHILEEQPVPSFFLCPIFQEIMHDPQVAADGFTYEGDALRGWFANGRETSPMTNLKLDHLNLTPNHALKLAIQDWLCKL